MSLYDYTGKKYTITGSYKDQDIEIYVFSPRLTTSRVTIIYKGLFSSFNPRDNSGANILGEKLLESNTSHVVYYNSSREFKLPFNSSMLERQEAFADKTFEEELLDALTLYNFINGKQLSLFNSHISEYYAHGSSLGGTIAMLMSEHIKKIKKLSLCAPATYRGKSTKPIISTMFETKEILDVISKFQGELFLMRGSHDNVVPESSSALIMESAQLAQVTYLVVDGANHNFTKLHGIETNVARELFADNIFDFLSGGIEHNQCKKFQNGVYW